MGDVFSGLSLKPSVVQHLYLLKAIAEFETDNHNLLQNITKLNYHMR